MKAIESSENQQLRHQLAGLLSKTELALSDVRFTPESRHGRRHHQVRNHCHHTLGIAVPRPCLFQPTTVAVWTGFHVLTGC